MPFRTENIHLLTSTALNRIGVPSIPPDSGDEEPGDEEDYHAGDPRGNRSGDREHDQNHDRDYSQQFHRDREASDGAVRVVLAADVEKEAGDEAEDDEEGADAGGRITAERDPEREYPARY